MRRSVALALVAAVVATPARAQQAPAGLRVAPSARATAVMTLSTGVRGAAPLTVKVDYGQPFARGRKVEGELIPADTIWRTGANAATAFTTDVDLQIGALTVPKGSYTLYSRWSPASGMQLVVNKQTGQWGTEYSQAQDLGRVAMTRRELGEAQDAFTITLAPNMPPTGPSGTLKLTWGKSEFSVPFSVKP